MYWIEIAEISDNLLKMYTFLTCLKFISGFAYIEVETMNWSADILRVEGPGVDESGILCTVNFAHESTIGMIIIFQEAYTFRQASIAWIRFHACPFDHLFQLVLNYNSQGFCRLKCWRKLLVYRHWQKFLKYQ